MAATSQGQILAWRGGSLWIGRTTAETGVHAHHAIQVTLALEGAFRLGLSSPPPEAALAAAIVAPDRPHAFIGRGLVALVFVEPESTTGRAMLARHCPEGFATLNTKVMGGAPAALLAAWRAGDGAAMAEAARALAAGLAGPAPRRLEPDPRVLRLVRQLAERPEAPPPLAEAAAGLRLSPGRLRHLFVAETGLHYRGYLLWLRLERAVREIAAGATLTEAAHVAGFADSAHLSRTFRRMFGLAPSSLRLAPDVRC